ncbi:integral membrane protein [Theileria parva strain Muguga]|uniref:Uncharacterized protein n=1 Tax=Theileria parva TaxID=5875 RepID=Q4N4T8_THEPA|nr:uncharacterized protein TpMuguga_02g00552 [Theileria parva strain Muguga]EAN32835.1 integral membrane protein [Theileria parva strain Muguga]|eukprot:XP_765118.1 hypothetical protein [Theileria parva strain Muguga]
MLIRFNVGLICVFVFLGIIGVGGEKNEQVTIDINKDATNPRERHYIVNKDIVSIAPEGYTEHIYEQSSLFDITNIYFGRKKLEAGTKELCAKSVEKIGVFWKFETPVLLYFKQARTVNNKIFIYYKLTSKKVWAKVDLTEEQSKHLPLSGAELKNVLTDIVNELGEIPEDRPITGIGSFHINSILSSLLLPVLFVILTQ